MCYVFGKMLMIRVHTDAHYHRFDKIDFRLDFRKHSAKFLSSDEQVIEPFNVDIRIGVAIDGNVHGKRKGEREKRSKTWGSFQEQDQPKIDSRLTFRMPCSPEAASACSL